MPTALYAAIKRWMDMPTQKSALRHKVTHVCILGLDLAGSPRRPTGYCVLRGRRVTVGHLFSDEDIFATVDMVAPQLIAIDAPLGLPAGRCCLLNTCACAGTTHFRVSDCELRRLGIRFFPITLGPMRQLTQRGMHLKAILENRGFAVIETYPGAAQDIWGIPRQRDVAVSGVGCLASGYKGSTGPNHRRTCWTRSPVRWLASSISAASLRVLALQTKR